MLKGKYLVGINKLRDNLIMNILHRNYKIATGTEIDLK